MKGCFCKDGFVLESSGRFCIPVNICENSCKNLAPGKVPLVESECHKEKRFCPRPGITGSDSMPGLTPQPSSHLTHWSMPDKNLPEI